MFSRPKLTTPAFTLPSFAKINWSLRILGKRPDGYHEVRTVLQTISLHDHIHFAPGDGEKILLTCDDSDVPTDDKNLIVRAANALRDCYGIRSGVSVRLEKRIPAKAGLGGASSNAAVALMGLAHFWELEPSLAEIVEIGTRLGADVPFFFLGGRALGIGIGAELTPLPDGSKQYLLSVTPKATISTAEAYAALHGATSLTTTDANSMLFVSRAKSEFRHPDQWPLDEQLQNDFERVIFDIAPEIGRVKSALLQAGARDALLAGSGSSVFGIFENQEAQHRALREIQAEVGWRIFSCVTLSRDEYLRAMSSSGTPRLRSFHLGSDTGA
jgi:4-diphosphocytidyl-2-C-methyl-D-erythritol kinase